MTQKPLVIDLDGTLIHTDLLHEFTLRTLRDQPLEIFLIPFQLAKGKAFLKQYLASKIELDPKTLPYNIELIEWLREQRSKGRRLVLCTASHYSVACHIADHLGIFDEVIASNGVFNLSEIHKSEKLIKQFNRYGYDYVGNSYADLPVWSYAHRAIIVTRSSSLIQKAKRVCTLERIFSPRKIDLSACVRMLRIHQWLKNFLLFVPLFSSHELGNKESWISLIFAFLSFSFCASSVYIINDLLDLESDRLHPRKRKRPLASGLIPVWSGVLLAPILLASSIIVAGLVGKMFLSWLIFYFLVTCAYSWKLKRLILIDCLTLAALYTIRVIAGVAVMGQQLSFWLLAFSVFLFLSLAFLKRYAELEVLLVSGKDKIHGRAYLYTDGPLIQTMGIVAGYSCVLVLALYLNSDAIVKLYSAPELIWGAVPVMLFWISWMWMQAHRGKMHDDPLLFAVKDRSSLIAGVLFAAILIAGTVGFSW